MAEKKNYDVIVIGAGPGGLTAALYAARANLKVVILDRGIYGGQMNNTAGIDNYPGFVDIQGPELGEKMYQTATNAGAEFAYGDVQSIIQDGNKKIVKTDSGEYEAGAVVILLVQFISILEFSVKKNMLEKVYHIVLFVMPLSLEMKMLL